MDILNTIEEIQLEYAYGECAVFAIALSEKLSLPIVEIYDKNDMIHVALVIEGKTLKEDRFLDVLGNNSYQDLKQRYSIRGKPDIQNKTISELKVRTLFSNEDIEKAKKDIEFLIEHNNFLEKLKLNPVELKQKLK